ncbi:hypothetical protein Ahy_A01g000841 [Arachis hypogaea]|uniref:BED-type domain-containing protein n=1 Tax=Arachis hypogaea TaxID=3818 RepID=A0A445ELA6_ARAHY|nr:hypothetical protein Ahy_A01g000841 [Arachis hypogaea]
MLLMRNVLIALSEFQSTSGDNGSGDSLTCTITVACSSFVVSVSLRLSATRSSPLLCLSLSLSLSDSRQCALVDSVTNNSVSIEFDGGNLTQNPENEERYEVAEDIKKKNTKATTSDVWRYFTKLRLGDDGVKHAQYDGCKQKFKASGKQYGTSSLKRHLDKCMKIYFEDIGSGTGLKNRPGHYFGSGPGHSLGHPKSSRWPGLSSGLINRPGVYFGSGLDHIKLGFTRPMYTPSDN